jgi:serine/threonine protein kinase/tetratricopeptide (TPR) repeat protein
MSEAVSHLMTLFAAARRYPPGPDRTAYLDRASAGDPALRAEVEALLLADEEVGGFLEPAGRPDPTMALGDAAANTEYQGASPDAGITVAGRYRLVEKVGVGGMGAVWRAEQTEPVRRTVALKLIKPGMDSAQVLARFEAERQALALMDHPNIAKVLDAGATPEGRPFFVMELVQGTPITQYSDDHHLTPRQRLELFVPVCHAVQHAHQKGIIHRDLKPSNVLVAQYDGKPVPKVIDFGVAKAAGQTLTDKTLLTGFGNIVGTLEYMSPEQAEVNQLDIDTRSDIYSLGVVLYELLAGSTPFTKKDLGKAGMLEMLRLIREQEPSKPSTMLSTADGLPTLAANRGTEPGKLTKMVRGELDWLVMKALEKDRSRRYETANGLAMDLQRYLADEPVLACPPSVGYRLRKFVRRHKGPVLAVALVFLTLLCGIVGMTFGLVHADQARRAEADRANWERQAGFESQAREAQTRAVLEFVENKILSAARPKGQEGGLGPGVTLRDAVVASLPALDSGFADQPLIEARIRLTLGRTFWLLRDGKLGAAQLERARAINAEWCGPDHPDTLTAAHNLAISYSEQGRLDEALELNEQTLAARRRVLGPDHPDTLWTMNNLAFQYDAGGRREDALRLREETLAARRRTLGAEHPDTLMSMSNLGMSYASLGRLDDAVTWHQETLAARRRILGPVHRHTLSSVFNLASCFSRLGRHADALKLFEETLAGYRQIMTPDHVDTLWAKSWVASELVHLNRGAEAIPLIDECVSGATGEDKSWVAVNALNARMRHFQQMNDSAGCRATAEMWENLHHSDADSLYNAARFRAMTSAIVRAESKTPTADATRLATEDADRAVAWLRKAVATGFRDTGLMAKDTNLDCLRGREDFKKVLAELEGKKQ